MGIALWALASASLAAGCDDRRRDDADLGGLVIPEAEAETNADIDVESAVRDPAALLEALQLPHSQISEILGAHRVRGHSSVEVRRGDAVLEKLSDRTEIQLDAKGNYRAVADNDQDYGRHAIYVDGVLYLRPRFGKFLRRAPNSPTEPGEIRSEMFSTVGAYFDLLWTRAELSDRGAITHNGRPARKIEIATAPTAAKRPAATLKQRAWRDSISVEKVSGEVVLDAESGAPLEADIHGTVHFVRDGKKLTMTVTAAHEISDIGQVAAVEAPAADETVTPATVRGEVRERRELLEGLSQTTGGGAKKTGTHE